MNWKFAFFVARRYLFSKKKQQVIHIISIVTMMGIAVGTMALVIILSVFNGFDNLVKKMLNAYAADFKVVAKEGKFFEISQDKINKIKQLDGVEIVSRTLEENALLECNEKQFLAKVKGVDENFVKITRFDTAIYDGAYLLTDMGRSMAILGFGVSHFLGANVGTTSPISVWTPKNSAEISTDIEDIFRQKIIYPSGIFSVEQEFDAQYIIVPIKFIRELLEFENELSSLEIKVRENMDKKKFQNQLQELLGTSFSVKNRYQQNEILYKIMESEKWAIFLILSFILIIASFNAVGSLTMLMIDKKFDIQTFQNLGAENSLIRKIFLLEGWFISFIGAIMGLLLGVFVCFLQQTFGIITFPSSGSFIVDAYPVEMKIVDFAYVFVTVLIIGFLAAFYPARFISAKHFSVQKI